MPDKHIRAGVQRRTNVRPSSEMQSTATTNVQHIGDATSISSVIVEPPQSDHPFNAKSRKAKRTKKAASASTSTPADAKEIRKQKGGVARAIALRKRFPTMLNIPNSITPSQKKKLILHHTQNATSTVQPTHSATNEGHRDADPAPTTQSTNKKKAANDEKQRNRAALLKQQYPDMEGIPPKIGQGTKKKLVAQYKARSSALAPSVTMPTSSGTAAENGSRLDELPTRTMHPPPTSGKNQTPIYPSSH